ncbi:putative Ig domain-containing protein [Luteibacter anthropi]|uniref:LamG-like jellyroll fold domain-containing protein n=1 Tax=Luteibacter anthropi TaxID=564369 RepID=UPI00203287BF|nr:putative Ig domain-containing protein [Luteibacter anthropi]URX63246.1 putative Ig domain-containing protein [Luteibacter anthropi]
MGYWYNWAMLFGWCKGPIDAFLEFRAGGLTAWRGRLTASGRIRINQPNLWGGEDTSGQGGLVGDMDVMFGQQSQQPNDYMLATFGQRQSARRGKLTTCWRGGRFGAYVANPKPVSAKVERILADWQDGVVWYPERAVIDMSNIVSDAELGPLSDGWRYRIVSLNDGADYSAEAYDDSHWSVGKAPFASAPGQPYAEASGFPAVMSTRWPLNSRIWLRRQFTATAAQEVNLTVFIDNQATVWVNGRMVLPPTDTTRSMVSFTIPASIMRVGINTLVLRGDDDAETGSGDYTYAAIKLTPGGGLNAMNPAHVLYDSVTHEDLQGEPVGMIHDGSFRAAADTLWSEGFGICTEYDSSSETPLQFQQRICTLIGASLSQSRVDGLYYLDLIRGDFDRESLPVIGEDDVISFVQDPSVITETGNRLSVEWFDPTSKEVRTTAPIFAMGNVRSAGRVIAADTPQYHEIPTEGLALRCASRDLKAVTVPQHKLTLTVRATHRGLRPGMNRRVMLPSEGIADMVVVIGSVDHGTATDGQMKIVAVQNIYGMPETTYVQPENGTWTPPDDTPLPSLYQRAIEAPYVELVASLSNGDLAALPAEAGYLVTMAARASSGPNYLVATAAQGENYATYDVADWCPTATVSGKADYLAKTFSITAGQDLDRVQTGSWALWDDEIVRVDALDPVAGTILLGRACADTVPWQHADGSRIYFVGDWTGTDNREYVGGDTVRAKLLTRTRTGTLGLANAPELTAPFAERAHRPYPPGNLQINGHPYPSQVTGALSVTWAHRDRLLQADQLVDVSQPDVGPEPGTSYTVRIYLEGTKVVDQSGLAGKSWTGALSANGNAKVEVIASRGGQVSWQSAVASFSYTVKIVVTGDAPDGLVGSNYAYTYTVTGGQAPYQWVIQSGQLPDGLTLDVDSGKLAGTPTAEGSRQFVIVVTDATGQTVTLADAINIAAAGTSYAAVVAADAPIAWWRLQDSVADGSVASDASGNSRHGTYRVLSADAGLQPGPSLVYGASRSYAKSGANPAGMIAPMPTIQGSYTVVAWIKTTDKGATREIVAIDDERSQRLFQLRLQQGVPVFISVRGTVIGVGGSASIADNAKHMVMATVDATATSNNIKLYVDGVLIAIGSADTAGSSGAPACIGCYQSYDGHADYQWIGAIADVSLNDKVLGADRAVAYYEAGQAQPKLVQQRTFDSAPASGEWSIRRSNPKIAWQADTQALRISGGDLSNFVSWDAWGSFTGAIAIESDIVYVAGGSLKHWGLYIDSGNSGQHGYRVHHLQAKWGMSTWNDGSEGSGSDIGPGDVVVGQTYTVRWEADGRGNFTLRVNGTYIGTVSNSAFTSWRPGWFSYGNEGTVIDVKAVRVYAL